MVPIRGNRETQEAWRIFDAATVEVADIFYVAIRIRRLTFEEYLEQVIPAGGLDASETSCEQNDSL